MKALTLKQPWATLVAIGAKKIETRSWQTRYRGPLAIHASKRYSVKHALEHSEVLIEGGYDARLLPTGVVVATCRVIQMVRITATNAPKEPELSFGDYTPGRWAWILHGIKKLPEPIAARGMLGLWNWEKEEPC